MAANARSAPDLKEKGNLFFKDGRMNEAAELYAKAEKLSGNEHVYPSNLSAALYEVGDYAGCRDAIFRACKLLGPECDYKVSLRLSTRLAKALTYGIRQASVFAAFENVSGKQEIEKIRAMLQNGTHDAENLHAWEDWDKALGERQRVKMERRTHWLGFLTCISFGLIPTASSTKLIGQDPPLSIIDFWAPAYPDRLDLKSLPKKSLSQLSFLFGGVGDGRMRMVIKTIRQNISGDHPRLPPYIHIDADTMPVILDALDYLDNFSPDYTAKGVLAHHVLPDIEGFQQNPIVSKAKKIQEKETEEMRLARATRFFDALAPEQFAEEFGFSTDMPVSLAREAMELYREALIEGLVAEYEEEMEGNDETWAQENREKERVWYMQTKSFVLPPILRRRHPGYEEAFQNSGSDETQQPIKQMQKVASDVETNWKPNLTFFDRACEAHPAFNPGGYPNVRLDSFTQIKLFNEFVEYMRLEPTCTGQEDNADAYNTMSSFFAAVADALKGIGHRLKLEFILGEHTQEMAKIRYAGPMSRADYTHGPLNVAVLSVPSLQDHPDASVASNCLLNTGIWESDDHYCHAYTLLPVQDVPRFLGCRVMKMKAFFGIIILGRHTHRERYPTSRLGIMNVRNPNSLVAFIHLLFHLHSVGFPAHWLSEFVQSILSGHMATDIAPFSGILPIPLSDMHARVARRQVRTDPWLAELESIIATAYEGLPFPVSLPAGLTSSSADIGVFEARVEGTPAASPWGIDGIPLPPNMSLLFYRPSNMYAPHTIIQNLRQILEIKAHPPNGAIQILTSQEFVDIPNNVIRWRMSRRRVQRMKIEGWVLSAYRVDVYDPVIFPVSAGEWKESHTKDVEDIIPDIEQLGLD
ncbi:hypothetical protein EVG20_g4091 [Dentipellis fragilis]|uniref:DUF4470 domain-containing protein n=1 Tax=Dentipellis fragilis TaxID=205917 RepID=A0A4Y9YZJ6_9AGAM|nr:hypothetical protein EVG20_g4091 [Dentipellis fragilis]